MPEAPTETYSSISIQLVRAMSLRDATSSERARLVSGTMSEAEITALATRIVAATPEEQAATGEVGALASGIAALQAGGGNIGTLVGTLEGFLGSRLTSLEQEIGRLTQRLINFNPTRAVDDPLVQANTEPEDEARLRGLLTPSAPARLAPIITQGPDGRYAIFDPNNPTAPPITGQIPGWEDRPNQVLDVDRFGNLIAIDPQDPSFSQVVIEGFGFPEIDPERQFAETTRQFDEQIAVQRQQVAGQFVGLELNRRGQMIDALTQDMAFQIELGRMTYDEANIQLNRVNSALDQRRAEREQALQFAVTKASIRTLPSGEQVTRLPFAEELASILTQTTGRPFGAEQFELPVGVIDPQQAGADVIRSTAFQSPIPQLAASLETSRGMISSILGAPVGTALTAEKAATAITEGL